MFFRFRNTTRNLNSLSFKNIWNRILYPQGLEITEEESLEDEELKEIDITSLTVDDSTMIEENLNFIKDIKKRKDKKSYSDNDEQPEIIKLTHSRKPSAMGISFRFNLTEDSVLKIELLVVLLEFPVFRMGKIK